MKYLTYLNVLIVITLFGCKSKQTIVNDQQQDEKIPALQIKMPAKITTKQQLTINISTNLDDGIVLFDPMRIRIERLEKDEWKKIPIVYCSCGADCIAPPREKKISKNEEWSMFWNVWESWCEKEKDSEMPVTIERKAKPGKYRSVFYYGSDGEKRIKIAREFEILN